MKIGDKLLCKKSGRLKSKMSYLSDEGHGTFNKGNWYEISGYNESYYCKEFSKLLAGKPYTGIRIRANYGVEVDFITPYVQSEHEKHHYYNYDEYFVGLKGERKKKLEKINDRENL